MLIRRAQADDVPAIQRIIQAAYGPYLERPELRRPRPLDDDYAAKVATGTTFVAVSKDEAIVGYLGLGVHGDHLLVENVAVDPASHGKGIGPWLLDYAEALAGGLGLPEMRLYTQPGMTKNVELYARLGWVETDRNSDAGIARVFFSKPVRGAA